MRTGSVQKMNESLEQQQWRFIRARNLPRAGEIETGCLAAPIEKSGFDLC